MTMTKKQKAQGPRKTQAEREAEIRATYLAGVDRVIALIAFQAAKDPTSAWTYTQYACNALIGPYWVPERFRHSAQDQFALAQSIPPHELQKFYNQRAKLLAEIVLHNEVPSYDLELKGEILLSDHDMASPYYVIRSGDETLYFYGYERLDGPERLQAELAGLKDTVKEVEDLLAL